MVLWKWIKLVSLVKLGWSQIHYLNEPLWTFTLRTIKNKKKVNFLSTTNNTYLNTVACIQWQHGRENISQTIYKLQREIHLINIFSRRGFESSEEITYFNNHDISYKNMICGDCIKELWDDMSRKMKILKELHELVKA